MGAWLTPADAAARVGYTVKTLANWRALGVGPVFVKVGQRVRYSTEAVDAWMAAQSERVAS